MAIDKKQVEVESIQGLETLAHARDFEMKMDGPKALGGTNNSMDPVEALLSAVGGCKLFVANAFASAHEIKLNSIKVNLTGDVDTDGLTGKNPEAKIGLMNLNTHYQIDADNTKEEIEAFIDFIDETSPVVDTIINAPKMTREI